MLRTLARNWWAVVLRGVVAVLFGIGTFAWPGITLATLILLFGVYALIDGISAVVWAVKNREGGLPWGVLLAGIGAVVAGVLAFVSPGLTALALLTLIAVWAIVRGVFEIAAAVALRKEIEGEWLLAASGALSVLFGLFLLVRPGAGALGLLWAIGAFAIVAGVMLIALGFRLKRLRDRVGEVAARPA
jgi:uncharacterized membrane protein HdeD (DUF308 family)